MISWSFSVFVTIPAKKEDDGENSYSQCVHLFTGDTSHTSVPQERNQLTPGAV